jgi:hypothetical protein
VDLRADQPDAWDLGRLDDGGHCSPLLPPIVPSRDRVRLPAVHGVRKA